MPAAIFDLENLIEIMDELRLVGHDIGTQQYIAAQNLLIALAANGQLPQNPRALRTWLAPVICSSPREQENFYRYFDRWLAHHPELVASPASAGVKTGRLPSRQEDEPSAWSRLFGRRSLLIAFAVLVVSVIAGIFFFPRLRSHTLQGSVVDADSNKPLQGARISFAQQSLTSGVDGGFSLTYKLNQLPQTLKAELDGYETATETIEANGPSPRIIRLQQTVVEPLLDGSTAGPSPRPTPTPSVVIPLLEATAPEVVTTTPDRYRRLRYSAIGFPFLLLGGWWVWRKRLSRALLQKLQSGNEPRLDQLVVKGASAQLFQGQSFRRTIQELRRHRQRGANELDAPRTVARTIQSGGLFTPSYGSRQTLPEYLVLIDRASFADQQARLEEEIVRRLIQDNVFVDTYYFQGDPRLCRKQDKNAPYVSLQEMAALHPDHHLIIFSDGSGFINPITGEPERWLEMFSSWNIRALMTPESPAHWGHREVILTESDFIILPATKDGLATLTEVLTSGGLSRKEGDRRTRPFPGMLRKSFKRWLENQEPRAEDPQKLCNQLKVFLGTRGYYWLSACAVYPALHWDLTLYLGFKLLHDRTKIEDGLLPLVRLPWFRYGAMPDWLRLKLIDGLPPDDDKAIRQALEDLFLTILQQPADGIRLDIAPEQKQPPSGIIRKLKTRLSHWKLKQTVWQFFKGEPPESPLRDYVFLSFMSGRKPRKLTVSLPDAIRRLFFPQGQMALGMRGVSALVLAVLCSLSLFTVNWWLTQAATNPPPAPHFYSEMSQDEQSQFLLAHLQQIATSIEGKTETVNVAVVEKIKPYVDAYVARIGNGSTDTANEDLSFVFGRATQYAPKINQVFKDLKLSPLIGLYVSMIESGYNNFNRNDAGDQAGLFNFSQAMANRYGLTPSERIDVAYSAFAAATFFRDSKNKLGGDSASMLNVVWSYYLGIDRVDSYRDPLAFETAGAGLKPEDWEYVPRFLAAAVIGENPRSFRLDMEPLSRSEIADLITKFKDAERRDASDRLVQLYDQNKDAVVSALIDAILNAGSDSYRVNLYIARTLGSIQPNWDGTADQLAKVQALRTTADYQDATFKYWVDRAISNYAVTDVIDCDCANIPAGRLTNRYRTQCISVEAKLKLEFKMLGRVTGTCDAIAQGPNAKPKGLSQPSPSPTPNPISRPSPSPRPSSAGPASPSPTPLSSPLPLGRLSLTADRQQIAVGDSVMFVAQVSSRLPNIQYRFFFEDGTSTPWSSSPRVAHRFQRSGRFVVSVMAAVSYAREESQTVASISISAVDSGQPVPNLVGRSEAEVRRMLGGSRQFVLGRVTYVSTGSAATGTVISQRPPAGEQNPNGTPIDIVVADSKADSSVAVPTGTVAPPVAVPKVVGMSSGLAQSILAKYKLRSEIIGGKLGKVISQDPRPGTRVPQGTVIQLVIKN